MNLKQMGINDRSQMEKCSYKCKGWLVVVFKENCPLVGPGPIGGVPSVGFFLRDSSPYLRKINVKIQSKKENVVSQVSEITWQGEFRLFLK